MLFPGSWTDEQESATDRIAFASTRGFDCKLQGSSSARCDFFLDGKYALQRGHFPWDVEPDEYAELMMPLTITAGLEKLAAATTAAPRSTATGLDAPETTTAPSDALVLDETKTTTKTTERRTTAPTGSGSPAEVKPPAPSTALTTADKPGSATNMRASIALLGKMLGLGTALVVP